MWCFGKLSSCFAMHLRRKTGYAPSCLRVYGCICQAGSGHSFMLLYPINTHERVGKGQSEQQRESKKKHAAQKFVVTLPVQDCRCIGYRITVRTRTLPFHHRIEPIFTRWGLFLFFCCLSHTHTHSSFTARFVFGHADADVTPEKPYTHTSCH